MNSDDGMARPFAAGASFVLRKADHDPRAAALSALSRVLAGEADSQEALDAALQSSAMVPSDKGLCTELLYGQTRMFLRLQWFSARFLRKPEKLPWEMRLCLEQALYSMAFLRMPQRAAVHWAVEHLRHRFGKGLAAVANGALRSMQRELASFNNYDFYLRAHPGECEALACWFSMPVWIVRLWEDAYGPEQCRRLLEASASAPPQALRLNRAAPGWEALRQRLLQSAETPGRVLPVGSCAILFERNLPREARQLVPSGKASRQSAASYAALEAFNPSGWPRPIWDCCAGRGGKTLALLEQGIAVAVASDPSLRRLKALAQEYARLGLSVPPLPALYVGSATDAVPRGIEAGAPLQIPLEADSPPIRNAAPGGTVFTPLNPDVPVSSLPEAFGTVLVDAPCSGLGTMSRYPEIRLRRTPGDCAALVALQKNILDAVWPKLLPGGRLVYLTCTANPAENREQMAGVLQRHADALRVDEYAGGEWGLFGEYFYGCMLEKRG